MLFAQAPPDPTVGMFAQLQDSLTTVIIPAAGSLIIIGFVFGMAVKWLLRSGVSPDFNQDSSYDDNDYL